MLAASGILHRYEMVRSDQETETADEKVNVRDRRQGGKGRNGCRAHGRRVWEERGEGKMGILGVTSSPCNVSGLDPMLNKHKYAYGVGFAIPPYQMLYLNMLVRIMKP